MIKKKKMKKERKTRMKEKKGDKMIKKKKMKKER